MPVEGYTTITIKEELLHKIEILRKKRGNRSASEVVTDLINQEYDEVAA